MTLLPAPPLSRDEGGMLSIASLFAVLGLLVGFALLANVGRTVGTKLEAQNAADAAALTAAVELARGMNAVTATNHLIGEAHAVVIIHHALGGDELDRGRGKAYPAGLTNTLATAHTLARTFSTGSCPAPIGYDQVRTPSPSPSGASVYDSRLELYKVMTWAYIAHAAGAILTQLKWIPIVGQAIAAVGFTVVAAAMVFEGKVVQEWVTLRVVEGVARAMVPVSKTVRTWVIPNLYVHTCRVAGAVPGVPLPLPVPGDAADAAERAAAAVGTGHDADATLFPGLNRNPSVPVLALPVVPEPTRLRNPDRSQLVRASTPWVQWWRVKWYEFGEDALLLSRFKVHYEKWTDTFTLELTKRAKQQGPVPIHLLVARGLDPDRVAKGDERWAAAAGSAEADRLFGVIGFARRPAPGVAALGYFRQPNPDGVVAFAQGMVYNANPVEPHRNRPGLQRVTGWDTLNWDTKWRVPEYPGPRLRGEAGQIPPPDGRPPEPRVKVNWQAKLVPTTRLAASVPWQTEELGDVLRRTPVLLPGLSNTH